uniref:Uncharacterized protein n=1 Tax=Panagrellus redivivus TaxID=6233 RepID=A0A7E4V7R4_PANRE
MKIRVNANRSIRHEVTKKFDRNQIMQCCAADIVAGRLRLVITRNNESYAPLPSATALGRLGLTHLLRAKPSTTTTAAGNK